MANISAGSLYDWVKQEKLAQDPYTEEQRKEELKNVGAWFSSDMTAKYYMLLSNERHDYTVFNFLNHNYNKAIQELEEVLETRGILHSIDYNHENKYYEIWMKDEDELIFYALFPCDSFIIEIQ